MYGTNPEKWEKRNKKRAKEQIKWHLRDIDLGACVMLIGEEPAQSTSHQLYVPKNHCRLFVAQTKTDEPILFIDMIEGGGLDWNMVNHWIRNSRGRELLYTLAATIYVAKGYGLQQIALGETESAEIGAMLGFPERRIFEHASKRERKIGVKEQDYREPEERI